MMALCIFCGSPESEHEPSGCCGDGGGSTFASAIEAGTAAAENTDAVHESAAAKADARKDIA